MNFQISAEVMDKFPTTERVKNTMVLFPISDDQKADSKKLHKIIRH